MEINHLVLKNLQSQAELLYCVAILFEVVQVLLLCTIKCKLILIYLCIFCAYRWEIIFLAIGRDFFSHPAVLLLVSSGQPRPMRRNSTQLLTWNIPENFTPSFCLFFFYCIMFNPYYKHEKRWLGGSGCIYYISYMLRSTGAHAIFKHFKTIKKQTGTI